MLHLLSKVMGSRKLNRAVVFTHLYLFLVAILVNSMIYLSITRPSFAEFYSGSVVDVPQELQVFDDFSTPLAADFLSQVHSEMLSDELENQALVYEGRLAELEGKLDELSVAAQETPAQQQVIVREVIKVVEVPVESPSPSGANTNIEANPSQKPVVQQQRLREDGSMMVKDTTCTSGFAWVTPRLVKTCSS